MNRFFITILVLAALLFPLTAAAAGNVPTAAVSIAKQLDEQIMMRFSGDSQDMSRKDREALARARIMTWAPPRCNINNLERSLALGAPDDGRNLPLALKAGLPLSELRKGARHPL